MTNRQNDRLIEIIRLVTRLEGAGRLDVYNDMFGFSWDVIELIVAGSEEDKIAVLLSYRQYNRRQLEKRIEDNEQRKIKLTEELEAGE